MKLTKYIIPVAMLSLVAIGNVGCSDIDLEPKGILDEGMLFNSDYGIRKYFAGLYGRLPIEDFMYSQSENTGYAVENKNNSDWKWDAAKGSTSTVAGESFGRGVGYDTDWTYWPYDHIRKVNTFLENFKYDDVSSSFTQDEYNNYLGEAYFLRAFFYFGMVKRYGGVPIVDHVLDPTLPDEELQLARSSEYDSWMFIHDDLQKAIELMKDDNGKGRANKFVAAALMSRAMLYAGTQAKYNTYYNVTGHATTMGLMKMEGADLAQRFLEYAYEAAQVVTDGGYRLHSGSNKADAFAQVFIEDTAEDIFVKCFGEGPAITPQGTGLLNSWDLTVLPKAQGLATDVGCMITPTWDLIDKYEHAPIVDEDGYPVRYERREDFWQSPMTEARLLGTVYFSGMTVAPDNVVLDFQSGLFDEMTLSAEELASDNWEDLFNGNDYLKAHLTQGNQPGGKVNAQGFKINGTHGVCIDAGDEGFSWTSSCIRKYVDYNAPQSQRTFMYGHQSWKAFRYGEVLCNWMEAAYELYLYTHDAKYLSKAQECLDILRDRAGATPHQLLSGGGEDVGSELYGIPVDENLEFIRDERARELAFENHRMYDLRRWRIFDEIYQNYLPKQLGTYLVSSEGKYIFIAEPGRFGRRINFNQRDYYDPIRMDGNNPNIIQNDRY